jgi:predicted AAA+ superfamily ATPase
MGGKRNTYSILVGKPERKGQLRRPRHKWEYNIRMELGELGWKVDYAHLVQDRDLVYTVINFHVS